MKLLDLATAYLFIRKLATPITSTEAYKLGIIDSDGDRTQKPLNSFREKNAWTYLDVVCNNLKKLLIKIPGGRNKIATIGAAMLLLKEQNLDPNNMEVLEEKLWEQYDIVANHKGNILEDGEGAAPVNAVGGGNIAGVGVQPAGKPTNFSEPPVRPAAMNRYKKANKKEEQRLSTVPMLMNLRTRRG